MKKAQCGWGWVLELGSRRGGREALPGAADHVKEGRLYVRAVAQDLLRPVVCVDEQYVTLERQKFRELLNPACQRQAFLSL